jgi:HSP20 family molecular chaperone IbpA
VPAGSGPWDEPMILSPLPVRCVRPRSPLESELMNGLEVPTAKRFREAMTTMSPGLTANVIEGQGEIYIQVELSGVEYGTLDVTLSGSRNLCITAERKQMVSSSYGGYCGTGYSAGQVDGLVRRTVAIPAGADIDSAEAQYENGVLTIRFTRRAGFSDRRTVLVKEIKCVQDFPDQKVRVAYM